MINICRLFEITCQSARTGISRGMSRPNAIDPAEDPSDRLTAVHRACAVVDSASLTSYCASSSFAGGFV